MPRISEMPSPTALTGLELVPALQGGGTDGNVGIPLFVNNPAFGGAVLVLRVPMVADLSATAEADPGAGGIRWNNADPHAATELYVSDDDTNAGDLATLFASLSVGGFLYVQGSVDSAARDNLQRWQVTSISAETGYTKLGVSLQASGGTFTDDDVLELSIQQPAPSPGINRNVVTAVASSSGTTTIDASLGDFFTTTLAENTTLTVANVPQACTISLRITQDATTARTVTFPASFLKRGGGDFSVPATLGARHRLIATTDDYGATWDVDIGEGYA